MLLNAQLLESNVVLEHFAEVDGYTLANSAVDRVVNIKLLKCVITGVEDRQDTDDTIMLDLVVSKVEGKHLIVREEKLSHHHGTVGLNFVAVEVKHLQVRAVLEGFSKVLSTVRLDLVSL